MSFGDFLSTNTTHEGGQFSERDFFAAMESAMKYTPRPSGIMVSQATIEKARNDVERLEREADDLRMDVYRRRRGWRKLRFLARRRAAEAYLDRREAADAIAATFGRRA